MANQTSADIRALTKAAEIIRDGVKRFAAFRSTRIPMATHVGPGDISPVAVITEGSIAPNAAPFEAAELHPLWAHVGTWRYEHFKWGKQPYWPYMELGAETVLDDAAQAYAQSIYDYAVVTGWVIT